MTSANTHTDQELRDEVNQVVKRNIACDLREYTEGTESTVYLHLLTDDILALIRSREQAAELRGRISEIRRCETLHGYSREDEIAELQATKPEKGTEQ